MREYFLKTSKLFHAKTDFDPFALSLTRFLRRLGFFKNSQPSRSEGVCEARGLNVNPQNIFDIFSSLLYIYTKMKLSKTLLKASKSCKHRQFCKKHSLEISVLKFQQIKCPPLPM